MSYVRRSGRLNPNYSPNQNPNRPNNPMFTGYSAQKNQAQYLQEEAERLYDRQRYYNPQPKPEVQTAKVEEIKVEDEPVQKPSIEKTEPETPTPEVPPADTSATTKALNKMEVDKTEKKPRWKKGNKLPLSVRRKKLNQKLSKILAPKSALILLHELKPGAVYRVQEQPGAIPLVFHAEVEADGVVLGTGQGLSKSQAKNSAAEDAIKAIVCKTMSQTQENKKQEGNGGEAMEQDESVEPENLPWAGLASFAMYKMFCEWQTQGTDFPLARPATKVKAKTSTKTQNLKKELPPNAIDLHPAVLLNIMKPGLVAVEVERESGPKCKVTMGYTIDGKTYTGVGGNKKDAKKEAAKAVISSLYGLAYPS